ncbi:hypothetical protein V3851_06255 [Paenibacillus sp. M1]|uniref:Uncharacterized protein n=1 Tax=Paenibacillus haidiansis TaxID=1574488 RepID=A0ABU7VRA0_9BACL
MERMPESKALRHVGAWQLYGIVSGHIFIGLQPSGGIHEDPE